VKLTRGARGLAASLFVVALIAAGCGDSKSSSTATTAATTSEGKVGGTFIDGAQLQADNLTSFDPGLVQTLDESQVTTAVYDGLTDFDFTDKAKPVLKGLVAEKFTPNADATEWTFNIKKGEVFSNGDPVLPSSFKFAWERNARASFASPYGYLIDYVKGGADMQKEGSTVTTLDAIKADDTAMTLTVTLEAPNADFAAIVSHPFFGPLPQKLVEAHMDDWGKTQMVGNGPFKMDAPASDADVKLSRNDKWSGNVLGDKKAKLDKIVFKVEKDPQGSYTDFESGGVMSASIPSGKFGAAMKTYPNTVSSGTLGIYYFDFGFKNNPQLSDEVRDNSKLRQAISLAIDREQINAKVYEGTRIMPTGVVMPGIPGYKKGICKYCTFDLTAAKKKYKEWTDAGGKLDGPITIDFNTGANHEDVVAIVQENLKAIGIESKTNPISEKYFGTMAKGGCHFCRSGWYADYPTYGNFTYDLFSTSAIGGNNEGSFSDPKFDGLLTKAQAEVDATKRADLYNQAEDYLLNTKTAAVPFNWYTGDQVYSTKIAYYDQPPLGIILWERVAFK
jgi:oligopeptide transport system substrate-binding protein